MEFLFLTLWFFYPYMDLLKVCSTKLIFTLLSALAAASTRDTDVRTCMERLQTNLQAYEKHQTTCKDLLHYTVFRPEHDGSATKDLFSLRQSLTGTITPDKMMTMITLRQCDRAIVESKGTCKVNLISVMQQYLAKENDRTFSAGNLKMTIDLVEAEFLLGYKMISSIQEDILMTCNNLNVLIIKNLDKIFFEVYKNWIIDRIEEFVIAMQDTVEENDGDTKSKIDELYEKYSKDFFEVMEMKLLHYETSVFNPAMRRYGVEFDNIYADVAKFEERRELKYFTANPSEFCRIFNHLTWKVYLHCLVEKISVIALEGFEAVKSLANEQKLKDVFFYDYTAKSTNSAKDNIDKEAVSEMYSNGELSNVADLNGKTKRQNNYFDSIGFKMLQDKLKSVECPTIDKLLQQFETQATTKICVNEKISINNFYDYLGVFGEENVCEELKTSKALFVEKGKVFEEENSILDESWDIIEVNPNDDVSMKAYSAREFKFTSKVICSDQKWDFSDQLEQQESVEISVTQENVNLDILPCIEILRSKSPAIMENKMTDLYKVSVKSSNFNVNIYLMNNIANDGVPDKNSIIYDITETDGINGNHFTSKKSIVYLEDAPIIFVQKLLDYLQHIQMTRPIKFELSNIMLLNDKNLAYIETNYKNSRTDYNLPQLPENFITKNMIRCRDNFRLGPKFESLLVNNRHITEFVKHTEKYSEAFGIKPADFECIIRKSFTDALFAEDELDDPFVITNSSIKYDLDCMPPISLNNDEPILHAFLAKKCKPMNLSSISPLQIIKRLMNSKKRIAVFTALTSIAEAMSIDVDTVPLMIEELLKIHDDGNTPPNNSMLSQNQLRIIFLQKIGCLFGYTDVWKTENTNEDEKAKKLNNICAEQKKLLTASIEVLVQVLIGSSTELKHHNTFKAVSIVKCKKNIVSEDKQLCDAKHSQYTLSYGNFESLKTIYEHCTAEDRSKEDEME